MSSHPVVPTRVEQPRESRPSVRSLIADALGVVRAVPVVGSALTFTQTELDRAQVALLQALRRRLDEVDPAPRTVVVVPPGEDPDHDQGARVDALLVRSAQQAPVDAVEGVLALVLAELQPDEARILSALSDGSAHACVHVYVRAGLGQPGEPVLEHASTVGRTAGVVLPELTPWYVTHLRRLGLVSVGPELRALADGYDVVATEPAVRDALAEHDGARLLRRSLRISALGARLWAAALGTGPAPTGRGGPGRDH